MNKPDTQTSVKKRPLYIAKHGNLFFIEALLYALLPSTFLIWSTPLVIISTYGFLYALLSLNLSSENLNLWSATYLLTLAYYIGAGVIAGLLRIAFLSSKSRIVKFDKAAWAIAIGWIYCAACSYWAFNLNLLAVLGLPTAILIIRIFKVQTNLAASLPS